MVVLWRRGSGGGELERESEDGSRVGAGIHSSSSCGYYRFLFVLNYIPVFVVRRRGVILLFVFIIGTNKTGKLFAICTYSLVCLQIKGRIG